MNQTSFDIRYGIKEQSKNQEEIMGEFLTMSAKQFRSLVTQGSSPYKAPVLMKKSKYHNEKTEKDGFVYDSKKEANRGDILNALQERGKIMSLERQKKFILVEPFDYHGKAIRGVTYIADFYYYDMEQKTWIAEDVKSPITRRKPEYAIKKKLFMKKYPEILFQEFI